MEMNCAESPSPGLAGFQVMRVSLTPCFLVVTRDVRLYQVPQTTCYYRSCMRAAYPSNMAKSIPK